MQKNKNKTYIYIYGNDLNWLCGCATKRVFIHWTKECERVPDGAENSSGILKRNAAQLEDSHGMLLL